MNRKTFCEEALKVFQERPEILDLLKTVCELPEEDRKLFVRIALAILDRK